MAWPTIASAQILDPSIAPPSPSQKTTDVVGVVAGVMVPVAKDVTLITGGLYGDSTGTDLGGVFAILNTKVARDWTLVTGYVLVEPDVPGDNPRSHNIRLGATYAHSWKRLTFDNRLLYEAVLADKGRENGNRIRNRARLTYQLAPDKKSKPRLFGYVEPIYDDRFDGIQITNLTAGAGASFGKVDADIYLTRLERKAGTGGDTNGVTLQMFYKF